FSFPIFCVLCHRLYPRSTLFPYTTLFRSVRIRQSSGKEGLVVDGEIPGDESNPVKGKLSLVDNTVDPATGTVRLKATFQNGEKRSEEHTSELQSHLNLVCRLLLEKKKKKK